MREGVMTEADTCRKFVTPRLAAAGWAAAPHALGEQRSFTSGRIIVAGGKVRRNKQKRADYLLYYRRDYPLAVVEAKEISLPAETGVQQAPSMPKSSGSSSLTLPMATASSRSTTLTAPNARWIAMPRLTSCLPA
jgi:type I site-specific restriction endonuclease